MHRNTRLSEYLVERLTRAELERLVLDMPDGRLLTAKLPDPAAGLLPFAEQAVQLLDRQGLIDAAFFDLLVEARPKLQEEIEALALLWAAPSAKDPEEPGREPEEKAVPTGGRGGAGMVVGAVVVVVILALVALQMWREDRHTQLTGGSQGEAGTFEKSKAKDTATGDLRITVVEPPPPPPPMEPVVICFSSKGRPVSATHDFRTGEQLTLQVRSPEDGYMTMVNVNPEGRSSLLFPWSGEDNHVKKGQELRLPPSGDHLSFQDPVGTEQVILLWSPQPTAALDEVVAVATQLGASDPPEKVWRRALPKATGIKSLVRVDETAGALCTRIQPQGAGDSLLVQLKLDHVP